MENMWTQIGNWGFPMVLSIYLLVRVEKKLDDLTTAIHGLGQTLVGQAGPPGEKFYQGGQGRV